MNAIIGRKLGMTRLYRDDGTVTPVTVIEAGPCPVVQVHSGAGDQRAVQLGFGNKKLKRSTKALLGHVTPAGLESVPAVLRSFPIPAGADPKPGETVTVAIFEAGDRVKATGTTKGKGFQGVVKRHGHSGGDATHGNTRYRRPGSLGAGTDPSRVIKGKRLPGQTGAVRHTEIGLSVVKVDPEQNLLFVLGAVPGPTRGIVVLKKHEGKSRYA